MMQKQSGERCPCLKGVSRNWLIFFNSVVGIIGFALFSFSLFNAVRTGDIKVGLGEAGIIGTIVAGAILTLLSVLGCVSIIKRSKCLLLIYLFMSFVLTFVVLGSGITLFFFVDDLNNVDGGDSAFADRVESQINDALIAVFNQCCSTDGTEGEFLDPNGDPIDKLLACDIAEEGDACFVFVEQYQAALDRVKSTGLCEILEETEVDGVQVVGNPQVVPGACANGDGNLFKAVFTDLVEDQLGGIAGAIFGLGVVLLFNLILTVCVLCANKRQFYDMEDYDENGKAYPYSFRQGPILANGGNSTFGNGYSPNYGQQAPSYGQQAPSYGQAPMGSAYTQPPPAYATRQGNRGGGGGGGYGQYGQYPSRPIY